MEVYINSGSEELLNPQPTEKVEFVGKDGKNANIEDFDLFKNQLLDRFTQNETAIAANTLALSFLASKADLSVLVDRLTNAETSISQTANAITLKASQSSVDALTGRITTAETSITQNAQAITLKASQTALDTLTGRVTANETIITQTAQAIILKASQTSVDDLTNRLTTAETTITQTAQSISLKASQSSVDALTGRITTAETTITQTANAITLKASQSTVDSLTFRVTTAETIITQTANAITLKAEKVAVDNLSGRVTSAETSITQNSTAIALKASQSIVDALDGRLATAESSITANSTAIALKVSSTSFTGENLVSMINQTAASIKISAKNINLDGAISFSYLDSDFISINKLIDGVSDKSFKVYHSNGAVAFKFTTNINGQAVFQAFNNTGEKVFDIDTVSRDGIQYVTLIPESFLTVNQLWLSAISADPTTAEQNTLKSLAKAQFTYVAQTGWEGSYTHAPQDVFVANSAPATYLYDPGVNPGAAANEVYRGYHIGNNTASAFITDGWYVGKNRIGTKYSSTDYTGPLPQTLTVRFYHYVNGKQTNEINLAVTV